MERNSSRQTLSMSSESNLLIHPTAHRLERCRQLARVLRITKRMLDAVEDNDWKEVAYLERRRRPDFIQCFDQPFVMNAAGALGEGLVALVCLNEELMDRLKSELLRRRYPLQEPEGGKQGSSARAE